MKNWITLGLIVFFSSYGFSQTFFGAMAGGVVGRTKLGNFKEYVDRYNNDFGTLLGAIDGKLKPMNFTPGYEVGMIFGRYNDGGIGITLELLNEQKFASTSVDFIDPALGTRVFEAKYRTNTLFFNTNYTSGDWASITGIYLGISHTQFNSYKRYQDGTISFGSESGSNLVDKSGGFCFGLKFGLEYFLNNFVHVYSNVLLGPTFDLSSDTPLPLADGTPYPLIYMNTHFTFHLGLKVGIAAN